MKKYLQLGVWCLVVLFGLSSCAQKSGSKLPAEEGNCWTDGDVHYQVVLITPDTLRMEGFSLHEGGMELVVARDEAGEWRIDGACGFGFSGSVVKGERLEAEGERREAKELLVAYYPEDADDYLEEWQEPQAGRPMQVLERFEGELEDYDLKAVHRFLANTYWDVKDPTRV